MSARRPSEPTLIVERIERGEGTLGKLSKDPALYDSSRQTMEKLASFVDRIDRADGTMGKLINDPASTTI